MGFPGRRTLKLTFADPQFAELKVRVRTLPMGEWFAHRRGMAEVTRILAAGDKEHAEKLGDELTQQFLDCVEEWNIEDAKGNSVPVTLDGLRTEVEQYIFEGAYQAWLEAMSGRVSGPLERTSNGGGPSVEASIPMEPLSESPPS